MKKALLAAGVVGAAVAGVVIAVSSRSGTESAPLPPASSGPPVQATTATLPPPPGPGPPVPATTATLPPVQATTAALPPPPGPASPRRRRFVIGVVDDSLAQQNPASATSQVDIARRAGFDSVVISALWKRGRATPEARTLRALRNVAAATRRDHMKLILSVTYGLADTTPRDGDEREQFAAFAAAVVRDVPGVSGVTVANEPNLPFFWKPQFDSQGRDVAALGYEDLLARTYDALKDAAPHVQVIGGGLAPRGTDDPHRLRTHSPTKFIRDLGAAYRASGRRRPLMDVFAMHPYGRPGQPPTIGHHTTTQIGLADYPKLVTLLDQAFRGTNQRGGTLPILYTEFGVQTLIPPSEQSLYEAGTTRTAAFGVSPALQLAYYREALALAYCQPTVKGVFIFHVFDEPALDGWQSGLYYADRTPKPSLPGFRRAVAALRAGSLTRCGASS